MTLRIRSLLSSLTVLFTMFIPMARAAEPFRLDRIGVVRFTPAGADKLVRRQGVLFVDGSVQWRGSFEMDRPSGTPDHVLDRNLITVSSWLSYHALGTGATWNFSLTEGGVTIPLGQEQFHFIAPSPDAAVATGKVINLSTRTRFSAPGDVVIAGFVVDERARKVLIRGVGPGLGKFGVRDFAVNPQMSLKRDGQTIATNDDWHRHPSAVEIREAASRVGAFPLDEGSADSAVLIELVPGTYTVHLEPVQPDAAIGSVLIEIYSVPEV